MSSEHPCCPPGSYPALAAPEDYKPQGKVENIGQGLNAYVTGETGSGKGILFVTDIFDFQAGRNKGVADQLAQAGYFVVIPDWFAGKPFEGEFNMDKLKTFVGSFPYETVLKPNVIKIALDFFEAKKINSLGLIGFCWGVWVVFHIAADPEISGRFKAAVDCHPSVQLETFVFGGDQVALAEKSAFPHAIFPAGNDQPNIREGGEIIELLKKKPYGDKIEVKTFEKVNHGFVVRGDISQPEVQEAVKEVLERSVNFFKSNL